MTAGKIVFSVLMILAVFAGCVMEEGGYQDSRVYDKALFGKEFRGRTAAGSVVRNPVIVIHGLLGSRLRDTAGNETVWGIFSPAAMRSGKFNRQLMHPAAPGVPLAELSDDIVPDGLLTKSEIQVLGMSFYLSNYDILLNYLAQAGFADEKNSPGEIPTLFVFSYDWRRDISENAVKLDEFISAKKEILQRAYLQEYGIADYDIQFDLVGHSMGGLLAGYYLRYGGKLLPCSENEPFPVTWAGSRNVDKAVMIGTPNAGYADALLEACRGLQLSSYAPVISSAVIGSFPSIYQMMPDPASGAVVKQSDHDSIVDIWDVDIWVQYGWGLAGSSDKELAQLFPDINTPDERRAVAVDHLEKCLNRGKIFRMHMREEPPPPPSDVKIFLIAGDALETNHTIGVADDGSMKVLLKDSGDGKITCSSARYDLRDGGTWSPFVVSPIPWSGICYLPGGHMGIMNSPVFISNLAGILASWPSPAQIRTLERLQ